MKMKKWFAFAAALGMTIGTTALSACGGGDNNDGGNGGNSSASSEYVPQDVAYTITIVDQDGDVVEGVSFALSQGTETVAMLETDANGAASGTLAAGTYTVNYTALPSDNYVVDAETAGIPIATTVSISLEDANVTLTIANYAFGTSLAPYVCYYEILDEETGETGASMYVPTVLANSDNYYEVAKAGDRIICIAQADVTVIYKGVSYSAKDGDIEIQSQAPNAGDLNYWAPLQIINDTDGDIELTMTFKEIPIEEGEGDGTDSGETVA